MLIISLLSSAPYCSPATRKVLSAVEKLSATAWTHWMLQEVTEASKVAAAVIVDAAIASNFS